MQEKETRRQAEGTITDLVPDGFTRDGIERFKVRTTELRPAKYTPVKLYRTGVQVL